MRDFQKYENSGYAFLKLIFKLRGPEFIFEQSIQNTNTLNDKSCLHYAAFSGNFMALHLLCQSVKKLKQKEQFQEGLNKKDKVYKQIPLVMLF